jgi:DNA-binding transcriptional ArsR family regulator
MTETIDERKMARVFKALSNPNRLSLYLKIAEKCQERFASGDVCYVTDIIIDSLKIGAPTISHHLKELEDAGLITTERRGKYLVANVNPEMVDRVGQVMAIGKGKK